MAERLLTIKWVEQSTVTRTKEWFNRHRRELERGFMTAVVVGSLAGTSSEPDSHGVFPDYSYHGKALSRVALQLLREGKTDSFADAGGFRREHLETVKKSVLLIEALDEDENWLKNFTGWIAGRDKDKLYIAIENHSIESDQPIESFRIWRRVCFIIKNSLLQQDKIY